MGDDKPSAVEQILGESTYDENLTPIGKPFRSPLYVRSNAQRLLRQTGQKEPDILRENRELYDSTKMYVDKEDDLREQGLFVDPVLADRIATQTSLWSGQEGRLLMPRTITDMAERVRSDQDRGLYKSTEGLAVELKTYRSWIEGALRMSVPPDKMSSVEGLLTKERQDVLRNPRNSNALTDSERDVIGGFSTLIAEGTSGTESWRQAFRFQQPDIPVPAAVRVAGILSETLHFLDDWIEKGVRPAQGKTVEGKPFKFTTSFDRGYNAERGLTQPVDSTPIEVEPGVVVPLGDLLRRAFDDPDLRAYLMKKIRLAVGAAAGITGMPAKPVPETEAPPTPPNPIPPATGRQRNEGRYGPGSHG